MCLSQPLHSVRPWYELEHCAVLTECSFSWAFARFCCVCYFAGPVSCFHLCVHARVRVYAKGWLQACIILFYILLPVHCNTVHLVTCALQYCTYCYLYTAILNILLPVHCNTVHIVTCTLQYCTYCYLCTAILYILLPVHCDTVHCSKKACICNKYGTLVGYTYEGD